MKKVQLIIYDIVLGEIVDNSFSLVENKDNINLAKEKYPLEMRLFKNGLSGLLYPIELLVSALDREDLGKQAGFKKEDTTFDKFYKLAGLNISSINGFFIKRG